MKNKRIVLITGASRGIGMRISLKFSNKNNNLILNYLNSESEIKELARKIESQNRQIELFVHKADISNDTQVHDMIERTIKLFGRIDVLINNAGISEKKVFQDITLDDWNRMINVNINGVFNCCRHVVPYMIKQKFGKIVNISSIWGLVGSSCEVHYSTSKAALIGFTKALAKELAPSNINVNCVAPGIIQTEMNNILTLEEEGQLANEIPMGRFGTAQEVAECVYFLTSDAASYITGQTLSPNGGFV